jgi:preprotein translocase subunit SecY
VRRRADHEFGIGNGIAIILFVSIISRFPPYAGAIGTSCRVTPWYVTLLMGPRLAIFVMVAS